MPGLVCDKKGFTCECGVRNDYPDYVKEHWNVRLIYSCECRRQYVVYRGTVQKVAQVHSDSAESEAFGD